MRQKRVLWVSNHTPFLVDFGGGQRSNLIYRILSTIGEVDVLLLCPPRVSGQTVEQTYGKARGVLEIVDPLKRGELSLWRSVRPIAPALVDKIAYNLGRRERDYDRDPRVGCTLDRMVAERGYDLIVGRHLKYPSKAGAFRYAPTIVDVDDNELELYRSIAQDPRTNFVRKVVIKRRVKSLERVVPRIMSRSTELWVSKEEDRDIPGCARASVLPNIPYGMSLPNPPTPLLPNKDSKNVLFVGMLSYMYNSEGISTFLKYSWPSVRQAIPDANLRLVGSRLRDQERKQWEAVPGVEVVGFAQDLIAAYRDCAFVVVPIWSGAGTNIKVLEALMHGRTCVVSDHAHRGYARTLRNNESLLVAKSANEMAEHCVALLRDPERAAKLAEVGAHAVGCNYSFRAFEEQVIRTVESAFHLYPRLIRSRTSPKYGPQ